MSRAQLPLFLLAPCFALFGFLALPLPRAAAVEASERAPEPPPAPVAGSEAAPAPAAATVAPPAQEARPAASARLPLGPMRLDPATGRYVASYGPGQAMLSLSPRLQQGLEKLLAGYRLPTAAVVLMEPRSGRVVAMAEHVERGPRSGRVALQAIAPAASIFKVVTSAALLDRGVGPDSEVCFHGGHHRIQRAQLADNPRRDRRCLTLTAALGKSANVVFAKLAGRDLTADLLRTEASRFLFNEPLPFDWPVDPSPARITGDPFELATTAAGFGAVRLSPLHGAVIASLVANGGTFIPPRVIESVVGAPTPAPHEGRPVLRPEVASALARMMETTFTEGTARKAFRRDRRLRGSPLREVSVAGKTGSLSEKEPFRDYTWFVGFAPVEDPQIAVAAVVVNDRLWRVKASFVAHEALKAWFELEAARGVRTASR
jgi:penicillin-binding protein A